MADAFLGLASSLSHMMIGVALWGVQIGISQSMFLSLIADHVPEDLRGTGIGFFYLISSVALIFAGTNFNSAKLFKELGSSQGGNSKLVAFSWKRWVWNLAMSSS